MSKVITASVTNQQSFVLPFTNLLPSDGTPMASTASEEAWATIVIPERLKIIGCDYISFAALSSNPIVSVHNCVVNLEYLLPPEMANTIAVLPNGGDIGLTGGRYKVEIRPRNGELLPIDIRSLYAISRPQTGEYSPYFTVTNITLWKRFFTSDKDNALTFLKDNCVYQGVNLNIAP